MPEGSYGVSGTRDLLPDERDGMPERTDLLSGEANALSFRTDELPGDSHRLSNRSGGNGMSAPTYRMPDGSYPLSEERDGVSSDANGLS